ncbi:MAG: rhodanese-like domain-containing protein [Gammaproteobacteria bacterium]|nr:rhodanese-like domain-containing protein [Gammaproteobacteria bacterium]MCP5459569.1 rhodanese-like domain-containing protein [Gammaproteobacteria bacterium]
MADFIEFATQNWILFLALVAILGWLISTEVLNRLSGIAAVNSNQALRLINDQEALVLDIRDGGDYKKAHIPDAVNIPFASLGSRLGELKKFKGKPVVLCCPPGIGVSKAGSLLKKGGFESIHNLSGGLPSWQGANLPVNKK